MKERARTGAAHESGLAEGRESTSPLPLDCGAWVGKNADKALFPVPAVDKASDAIGPELKNAATELLPASLVPEAEESVVRPPED